VRRFGPPHNKSSSTLQRTCLFTAGDNRKIAVKIIDNRVIELSKVMDLE
jgi:hypothetical protein